MRAKELEAWLPLWQHLHDAEGVAGLLWDRWLPPLVRDQIADATGGDGAGRAMLRFLAGTHDIGKATPAFAIQVDTLRDALSQAGLAMPRELSGRATRPHGLAGQVILEAWLVSRHGWTDPEARALASVVGGHHGIPPSDREANDARAATSSNAELLGAGPWREVQEELLDHMAERTGATRYLDGDAWRDLPRPMLAMAEAVVVVADWLASNQDLFPLVDVDGARSLRQPDGDDERRLTEAWEAVALPAPWTPDQVKDAADVLLRSRFDLPADAEIRPVQCAAVEAARAMDPAGILVIEAPMGEGKTEAAILAAEELAARSGAGGLIVALPTQATSDAMFSRVMKWIANKPPARVGADVVRGKGSTANAGDERHAVFLAHGKAWLNPDYEAVPRGRTPVIDVGRDEAPAARSAKTADGGAYVDGWMRGNRKGVLADFVVGTIDQVLFMALSSRHVALRHLAMARKVVILDEIHSFDAYMNVYLERALEWLGAYRVPVVALSATLPAALRGRLVAAYQRGLAVGRADSETPGLTPGARRRLRAALAQARSADVTSSTGDGRADRLAAAQSAPSSMLTYLKAGEPQSVVPESSTRAQAVRLEVAGDREVPTLLAEALADGGCALVVRNTVLRAQETYRELRDTFGDDAGMRVVLLHSRFLASDRKRREAEVVRMLGKPGASGEDDPGRDRLVVVGTQVVEQSLDIDADLLVTDLAPTDLLLQRIGRLHRHQERTPDRRPPRVREARAVVVGVEDWTVQPPKPVGGSTAVYGDYLLLRAAAQVLDVVGGTGVIELPRDIAPLVQAAYDADLSLGPEQWQAALRTARRKQDDARAAQEERAKVYCLPRPGADRVGLSGWLDGSIGEADVRGARAQVRDSEDSLEVIVVQTDEAGQWRLPDWFGLPEAKALLDRSQIPPPSVRKILAGSTVRLSASVAAGTRGDAVIDYLERLAVELDLAAWQQSRDLAGQLVLPLDGNRQARLPGWLIGYDRDTGLRVEKA